MTNQLKLTKRDILQNFDNKTYLRGHAYYVKGKVRKYELYDDGEGSSFVRSKVDGSYIYSQHIEFNHYDDLDISGDCSCPVGHNCKHVVAVLFEMLSNNVSLKPEDTSEQWLKKFMQIHQAKDKNQEDEPQEEFLIIRLFRDSYDDFDFCKAKMLKSGSVSKGMKVSTENMIDPKETWALVSVLVYAFILHMRFIPGLKGNFAFNFAALIGYFSILMTYFGVNYYLSGLHSYAAGDPVPVPDFVFYAMGIIAVLAIWAFMKEKKFTSKTE